ELCHAEGKDKRFLTMSCGYAVDEMVPEMKRLDRDAYPNMWAPFGINLCKSCRARLLGHMQQWRDECVALRGRPKDHDGHLEDEYDPDRNIPVRVNGVTQMMTADEYEAFRSRP